MHASGNLQSEGKLELLFLRLAVTNAIVDPWIYILLRKETLESVQQIFSIIFQMKCCGVLSRRNSDRQSLSEPHRRNELGPIQNVNNVATGEP